MADLSELENIIGYKFKNRNHLRLAVTHSSYANEKGMAKNTYNERIEFLGDAVLEFISSSFIYNNFPDMQEGEMTVLRAKLVCEDALSYSAVRINLGGFLLLGRGEEMTGGRERKSLLCDAFEALIGAIYLDGGIEPAGAFINKYVLDEVDNKLVMFDSKTTLQEMIQSKHGTTVTYKLLDEEGPQHNKTFTIAAMINGRMMGTGVGHSKKEAEKEAAYKTILMIKHEAD